MQQLCLMSLLFQEHDFITLHSYSRQCEVPLGVYTWCALWVKVLPEGNHRPCIGRGIWLLVLSQGLQRVGLISTNLVSSSWLVYHISRLSTSGHYVSYIKLSRLFKGQRKICLFWFKSINMVILILCCVKTQS